MSVSRDEPVLALRGFELSFQGRTVRLTNDLRSLVLALGRASPNPASYADLDKQVFGGLYGVGDLLGIHPQPSASQPLRELVRRLRDVLEQGLGLAPFTTLPRGGRGYCLTLSVIELLVLPAPASGIGVQSTSQGANLPHESPASDHVPDPPEQLTAMVKVVSVVPAITRRVQPKLRDGLPEFHKDELIRIEFQSSTSAFGYLLDVDTEGEISLLLPSGQWRENALRGGETYVIPRADEQVDLPLTGPPGVEMILFLATARPAPVLGERQMTAQVFGGVAPATLSDAELARVAAELATWPRHEWAVGEFSFVLA